MSCVFERIAILGVGLIGSSMAHAARAAGAAARIDLYDPDPAVRARARELGLGETHETAPGAVREADLVVLAMPVGAMGAAMQEIAGALKPGAVLTDVGSVKGAVVAAVRAQVPAGVRFVPGHPIAGTERSGPDAGFATLFKGRWHILTPLDDPDPDYPAAIARLAAFWRALGAEVELMDPARHDVVLAVTSHLPHLIAFNIVAMAEDLESVTENEVVKYSASGFRDFTRIAASDPTMWRDVFLANRDAVLDVLGRFSEELAVLRKAIRAGDGRTLFDLFARARRVRREVIEAGQDSPAPNWGRDDPAR
ncbi:MAG: prephenate/arogenate dehydrogenase family protein [Hydrogenophilaceae bacterium]|jgi:cyclohexadieny/prephenate dehydrogenase|nr:prephenate/arogenate dehydrogenase family protein [Hydrogenophilaceae bacterium]